MTARRCTVGGKEYLAYHELDQQMGVMGFVDAFFVELGHKLVVGAREGYWEWVSSVLGVLAGLGVGDRVKWVMAPDGGVELEFELEE